MSKPSKLALVQRDVQELGRRMLLDQNILRAVEHRVYVVERRTAPPVWLKFVVLFILLGEAGNYACTAADYTGKDSFGGFVWCAVMVIAYLVVFFQVIKRWPER